jgi:hypothetical protein
MTEQDEQFFKLKEGKRLGFLVHDQEDEEAMKVGEAPATDTVAGEGLAALRTKSVDP